MIVRSEGAEAIPGAPAAIRLLLVEDNPDTLRALTRLLEVRGFEVVAADRIATAHEAARAGVFDVVVSDIGLPDGSGLDLIRKLRSIRPVRAIALSGYGMDDDIRRSRQAGCVAHLTKPVDFSTLETTIRRVASLPLEG